MSFTPKTPASSGGGAGNTHRAEGSKTKPTPRTATHLMAMTGEPSPASTYGETVVGGDSVPATPLSENGTAVALPDVTSGLNDGLHKMTMNDAVTAVGEVQTRHPIYGLGHSTNHLSGSSPAQLGHMVDPGPSRPFVLQSTAGGEPDDPFTTGSTTSAPTSTVDAQSTTSGSDDNDAVDQPGGAALPAQQPPITPNARRLTEPLSPENAQAIFLPDCCVFVAKYGHSPPFRSAAHKTVNSLPTKMSDEELGDEVTRVFKQFGDCYVKIKRDARSMPHAFVQYTCKADSMAALEYGGGNLIFDRQCRVESSNAFRSIYLSRRDGTRPVESAIRTLLEEYGPIERIWYPTDTETELWGLPRGCWVKFMFWQDYSDACRGLRDHAVYRAEERKAPRMGDTFHHLPGPVPFHAPAWFDPSIHDPRGVFVGDLPHTVKEHELLRPFLTFGRIETIRLRLRPGGDFANPEKRNRLLIGNNRLVRVEFKRRDRQDIPSYSALFAQFMSASREMGIPPPGYPMGASNMYVPGAGAAPYTSSSIFPGTPLYHLSTMPQAATGMSISLSNQGMTAQNMSALANVAHVPNSGHMVPNGSNGNQWVTGSFAAHHQTQ
ncbi:hypothetical protein H2199_005523 [Coniosporium tulheliwenetii]|uniref:Uncharacterized protein n=1 Tax=Coniosporium tulheliwenetii TaxID=3383036 RepID=A0ACC2Z1F3_9PEZI|nr:hypothetical protein H2199_005523 [Cladosporium sp. JES 115]